MSRAVKAPEKPDLTVVVPHAGIGPLAPTMRSLAAQSLPTKCWEVIVVDEAGTATREVGASGILDLTTSVRIVPVAKDPKFTGHTGPRLRNVGAKYALAPWLVFIDADCIVSPLCLERHQSAMRRAATLDVPIAVCGAMLELSAHSAARFIASASYEDLVGAAIKDWRAAITPEQATFEDFYSANVSVSRQLFEGVAGFNETGFRCHDMEFAYRLSRRGVQFIYDAECAVIHIEHPRVAASRLEQAEGWRQLAAQFPELSDVARQRIQLCERSFERVLRESRNRFKRLTRGLPGSRIGSALICPPGTPEAILTPILDYVPHIRRECRSTRQFYLRLDRNCWDFSVLMPDAAAPCVAVVIPAFNAEETIAQAIDSVLTQTMQAFELIVVDDGSTDRTPSIARRYASAPHVRLITISENVGQARALNRALGIVAAPLILQLDADDWLDRTALEQMVSAMEQHPEAAAAYANPIIHEPDGSVVRARAPIVSAPQDVFEASVPQVPRIYRVEALRELGGWCTDDAAGGRYYEDRWMLGRLARRHTLHHVNVWLYHVRRRPGTLSTAPEAMQAKLAILVTEASRLGCSLSVTVRGRHLKGELVTRRSTPPKLPWSVILVARNHRELLGTTLRSWLESDWLTSESEMIVVDDGSRPSLGVETIFGELLHVMGGVTTGQRVKLVTLPKARGPAAARNWGAALACHSHLMFADGDHIVPPDVMGVHEYYHQVCGAQAIVVGGPFGRRVATHLAASEVRGAWLERLLTVIETQERFSDVASRIALGEDIVFADATTQNVHRSLRDLTFVDNGQLRWAAFYLKYGTDLTPCPHAWLRMGAANLSMPGKLFRLLRGFDERLKSAEDWDIAVRARAASARLIVALECETYHQMHTRTLGRRRADCAARRAFGHHHGDLVADLNERPLQERPPGHEFFQGEMASQAKRRSPWSAGCLVALTFDDGPRPRVTAEVLRLLEDHGARATFFVLGECAQANPDLIRSIVEAGHEIGVHGWSHRDPSSTDAGTLSEEYRHTASVISAITGTWPRFLRPAYGCLMPHVRAAAREAELEPILWTVSTRDWSQNGWRDQVRRVAVAGLAGQVVLLHDGAMEPQDMLTTTKWLLSTIRAGGLNACSLSTFVSLRERMLDSTASGASARSAQVH